jgi:SAM-dependent methyltransferase
MVPLTDKQIAGGFLVSAMWWYAATVLSPAQQLKRLGLFVPGPPIGELPQGVPRPGLGPRFSRKHPRPVFLKAPMRHQHLVEEFDHMADVYAEFVQPFSRPIFDEALQVMTPYLRSDSRVLDAGCGPGRELERIARLVPQGEVVGIDLAPAMIQAAHGAVRARGLSNCAFFQADIGELPERFSGQFDLVYSCLAHHHYPEPAAAAAAVLRCLRPGGVYCVCDPGPAWYNTMSAPMARWADPGWIGFHSPEEFRRLFRQAGFARAAWVETLPGFGLALGQRAARGSPPISLAALGK